MISDRTKQFIFNNLIKDLSNVEIIRHDNSLWFIDREKKYWYLELVMTGKLYWRYQFFTEFFVMYSIERNIYEPIIKEFVESVLNCAVSSTKTYSDGFNPKVNSILNSSKPPRLIAGSIPNTSTDLVLDNGITSTEVEFGVFRNEIVEDVLNNGVTSMASFRLDRKQYVDSALNNGVTSMYPMNITEKNLVESALNNGVTSSRPANKSLTIVDSVLSDGVTSMGFTNRDKPFIVESVLTNGVTTKLRGGNATEQIESVLKNGITY